MLIQLFNKTFKISVNEREQLKNNNKIKPGKSICCIVDFGKWRSRKNDERERLSRKENMSSIIRNRRLRWAVHALKSRNQLIRMVMDEEPVRKIRLGTPKLRREDVKKKDVEALNGGLDWKARAADREGWRIIYVTGWS